MFNILFTFGFCIVFKTAQQKGEPILLDFGFKFLIQYFFMVVGVVVLVVWTVTNQYSMTKKSGLALMMIYVAFFGTSMFLEWGPVAIK